MSEYPEESRLRYIKTWSQWTESKGDELIEFIKTVLDTWNHDYGSSKLTGKKVLNLQLNTGGWSGNEDIIGALSSNTIFWSMYWQSSIRGGRYNFKIKI
jgi:hypothetical protein